MTRPIAPSIVRFTAVLDPIQDPGRERHLMSTSPTVTLTRIAQWSKSRHGSTANRIVTSKSEGIPLIAHEDSRACRLCRDQAQVGGNRISGEQLGAVPDEIGEDHDAVLVDQVAFGEGVHDAGAPEDDDVMLGFVRG